MIRGGAHRIRQRAALCPPDEVSNADMAGGSAPAYAVRGRLPGRTGGPARIFRRGESNEKR